VTIGGEKLANIVTIALLGTAIVLSGMSVAAGHRTAPMQEGAPRVGTIIKDWRDYANSGHRLGSRTAPVVITEFSDFLCPFCARSQGTLRSIRAKYGSQVAIAFHHWPQPGLHPQAVGAAIAAECAADQGRFETYHDLLFARQDSVGRLTWTSLARRAGVRDTLAFGQCVVAARHQPAIMRDAKAAEDMGGRGTPFFLINSRVIPGALPLAVFDSVIQVVLAEQRQAN